MNPVSWVAVAVAATVGTISPLAVRPILAKAGVVDRPNDRSSHVVPTTRGGGVAPALAFAIGIVIAATETSRPGVHAMAVVGAAALLAGLVGLAEDVRGLGVAVRGACHLGIGGIVVVGLAAEFATSWWLLPLGCIGVAFYINVANFMDGINGISGLHGIVAGVSFALIGDSADLTWLPPIGLILAASFAGFLPWNLTGPGLFLGDVGSYLLGAAVAASALAAVFAGVTPVAAFGALAIYAGDASTTLVRRAIRREPVLRPHRTHTYQRLTDVGLSHLAVSTIVAVLSAATAAIGLATIDDGLPVALAAALIVGIVALYVCLPRLLGNRLPAAPSLTINDVPTSFPSSGPRPEFEPRRWAVLGGSGFIGAAITRRLRDDGFSVTTVAAPRLQFDAAGSTGDDVVAAARLDPSTAELAHAFAGTDVVINAAGLATPDASASPELYGANALLPAVVALAATAARVPRVIHLSSAAVQGRSPVLDDTLRFAPFSAYSHSKALGEVAFLRSADSTDPRPDLLVVRGTSVQGPGRPTTASLQRVARSPLSSVAAPGTQPTVVSSVTGLADFVLKVAATPRCVGPVLVQPWEGLSVSEVLELAGAKPPHRLPRWFCRVAVTATRAAGRLVPEIAGAGRRAELMWLGQAQQPPREAVFDAVPRRHLAAILRNEGLR